MPETGAGSYGGAATAVRPAETAVMKAVAFDGYGGPEAAQVREVPRPQPGPGEALVRLRAASVNPVDWKVLAGLRKPEEPPVFPRVLGLECAGTVEEAVGAHRYLRKGAHVIGHSDLERLGAFAEYIVLPEEQLYPKPEKISFEEAACVSIAGCTALQALRDLGGIAPGKKVLVNGASGGVGHFAVQIARIFRTEITAVCGADGVDLAWRLGADHVIDRKQQDFTRGKGGYDIIFDAVAKSSFAACRDLLAENGVYISTLPVDPPPGLTSKKAVTIYNSPTAQDIAWLTTEMEAGSLSAVIDKVFPLDRAREALAYSLTGKAHGKVILKIE